VIVIEHNLDVLKTADHVIDLGPGGGDAGGEIVAAGTPAEVAANPGSATGEYLARMLRGAASAAVATVSGGPAGRSRPRSRRRVAVSA
jgi:excinuclease ABC subunit A